jgi:hypothetical protein
MIWIVVALAGLTAISIAAGCGGKGSTKPYGGGGGGGELSGSLPSNGSVYSHTFTTAGKFDYLCTIHPSCASLHGTVYVVAPSTSIMNPSMALSFSGGSSGGYGGGTCSGLSRNVDSVHVGDQVVWTNNSTLPHTVTSQ